MNVVFRAALAVLFLVATPLAIAQPAPPPAPAPGGPVAAPVPNNWERTNVSFGLNTYTGDTDSQQLMTQLNSTVELGRLESDMIGNVGIAQSEGQHQSNQEELDWAFRYTLRPSSHWFAMIHTWYEHDETAGIDFRGAIGPGVGIHAIDNKKMRLTLEGGLAATTEEQVHDQRYVAVFFDPSLRWNITKLLNLQHKTNFRFNTRDHRDVRIYTNEDLTLAITKRVGIGFGFTIDFDNQPVVGHRKTDIQTATTLTVALGRQQQP